MDVASAALVELGQHLRARGYRFVTVTPETHRRVLERDRRCGNGQARTLRDVFGWNKPFAPSLLCPDMLRLLEAAELCTDEGSLLRARVRFSSLDAARSRDAARSDGPARESLLFAHSGFPTTEADAVFFGPDTYRFYALLERAAGCARRVVDVGCGSGVGGIVLAGAAEQIVLADINERALRFARVNAALAGVDAEIVQSDVLAQVEGELDLVISNPPYLRDDSARVYREGGGAYGEGLAVRIAKEALQRLAPGGRLLLYTGAAVVSGEDQFYCAIRPLLESAGARFSYTELDPDVFGEELDRGAYTSVERLAAVALHAQVP
jgi:SAM-dependent methyltransferase